MARRLMLCSILMLALVFAFVGCDSGKEANGNKQDGTVSSADNQPQKKQAVVKKQTEKETPKKEKDSDVMSDADKRVVLETSKGTIVIELNAEAAPVSTENFLRYVNESFFDGTIFHRVIPNFMAQGGGFTADMVQKKVHAPIVNEANNGLKNDRGTLAMARTPDPDSATAQFFINVKDNAFLNYKGAANPGYAVFARVVEGMDVVDAIVAVKTATVGHHADVPTEAVVINSAKVVSE